MLCQGGAEARGAVVGVHDPPMGWSAYGQTMAVPWLSADAVALAATEEAAELAAAMAAAHPPVAARGCRVHVRLSVTVCHTHESVPRLQEHFSLRPPPPQSPAVPAPMYRAVSRVRARAAAQAAADNWLGLSFNAAASKGDCGAASEAAMGRRRRRRRRRARARRRQRRRRRRARPNGATPHTEPAPRFYLVGHARSSGEGSTNA